MTAPSPAARRFRTRLNLTARMRRISPGTILTIVSLAFLFVGVAGLGGAWLWGSFILVGALLALLTPIGAAVRILLRGK